MSTGSKSPFHPAVQAWFDEAFQAPTPAQALGWPAIVSGASTLLFAPTGSGKTLAAFLAAIDRLMFTPVPGRHERCRVLYVSPLRALAVDVEKNLRAPLQGIARAALRLGVPCHVPEVGLRTGDTPQAERARQRKAPPDILVTTPESLYLLLTSEARRLLAPVRTLIVDEIHALCATKRGAHLALSLERLQALTGDSLQRIGLSATQRPLEEVARFLGGCHEAAPTPRLRPVAIVDGRSKKAFELKVEVPVEDMSRPGEGLPPGPDGRERNSIWPAIQARLVELIRAHRSTIVFVNSRRLAERLAAALNELAGEELSRAHHGSIAREQRLLIEQALKDGQLPALVATSSLELGIDMGAVDLVVQIEAPPSVASGLQRIGRSGHRLDAVSKGVIFPKFRGDLLAVAALTRAMAAFEVEATRIPRNPLDVLAQQLVSLCTTGEWQVDDLFALVRRAAPFVDLPRGQFEGLLDLLSGRYPADDFAELRPRLVWDRLRGRVRARDGARLLAVTNAGTIPDRGLYGVFLAPGEPGAARGGRRVGELDEEMVFESKPGDVFLLGASSWRIVEIDYERVLVEPAPGQPGKIPFWKADAQPRPVELGRAIGRLTRELLGEPEERAQQRLEREHFLDARAARNLLAYLQDQRAATGVVPDDTRLVLERGRDELGDWRLCLLSPYGGRVHAPWALALQAHLRRLGRPEAETVWSDDGIVVRLPDSERAPEAHELLPELEDIEALVASELQSSPLFAATFREAAGRALLLPRRRPGQRTPLWRQRKRASDLLQVAARHPDFPLLLESYRECLLDLFDLPALSELAKSVRERRLALHTVDTERPSPFAASLLFGYVANYLYEGDAPLAERKAQALVVDPQKLRELLGEAELRELLDERVLREHESLLQCLGENQRARSADRLHDLLLRLGDLSAEELAARSEPGSAAWLQELLDERRVVPVEIAGEPRYAATEDAGRLRDGLGVTLPDGLPAAFLEPVPRALEELASRFARTRGPFETRELSARLGVSLGAAEAALRALLARGRVLSGEFRPGGQGLEWCDAEVLQALRRRSLATLRRAVEPAEPRTLARLLVEWHGLSAARRERSSPDALMDVIAQLQGAPLPASALEREILPARLPEYRPQDLDLLCAAGEVLWVGRGALSERDGRVSLYLAEDLPLLFSAGPAPPAGELHAALRDALRSRGASFFPELHALLGGLERELLQALWDLIWAGEVLSDAPGALRAFVRPPEKRRGPVPRGALLRARRASPPSGSGRFSLLRARLEAAPAFSPTERLAAQAEQLLARHGILTRDAVAGEEQPGGFSALYPVLRAMEDAGRARRGYFVSGLGAAQFAEAGALERLRALKDAQAAEEPDTALVLAACDPGSPYGASLPWPKGEGRLARAAGALVMLAGGALVGYSSPAERELITFLPEDEPERSRQARALGLGLARWLERSGRLALPYESADGVALAHAAIAMHLRAAGLVPYGLGFRLAGVAPALKP